MGIAVLIGISLIICGIAIIKEHIFVGSVLIIFGCVLMDTITVVY